MKHSGKLKTIEDVFKSDAPSIASLKKAKGVDFTEGMIMGWLVYLNNILNLNKPMTEDQIELCAVEVVKEFYYLKFSDLTFLFKRIISGAYGEYYESLTIPKVLTFFRDYDIERASVAEGVSLSQHNDLKSNGAFNYSNNLKRIFQNKSERSGK